MYTDAVYCIRYQPVPFAILHYSAPIGANTLLPDFTRNTINMHSGLVASVLASLCLSVAAQNTSAPIVYDNPPNVYELMLLDKTNTTVRGYVRASAPSSGVGVRIHADFWGLPDEGPYRMPFYHRHTRRRQQRYMANSSL